MSKKVNVVTEGDYTTVVVDGEVNAQEMELTTSLSPALRALVGRGVFAIEMVNDRTIQISKVY